MTYKPTFEDYEKMGQKFKEVHDAIVELHMLVSKKIGKTKTDKLCDFWRFDKKFQRLRSEVEEMMFRDYPDKARLDIFYGDRVYFRPTCPRCRSDQLGWIMASGNGLVCLECGRIYFLTEGKQRKHVGKEECSSE